MERLGERLIRRLPLLSGQRHIGTRGPCISIKRVQLEALVEPFLRLHGILLMQIHLGLQGIGVGIILPFGDDGIQLQLRLVVMLLLHEAECTIEPVVAVARLQTDGSIVIGDGIREAVLTDTADGTQVVDIVDIGIQVQRLRGITLCTHIIIEIKLGNTSVIPRLIEIRLGTDG